MEKFRYYCQASRLSGIQSNQEYDFSGERLFLEHTRVLSHVQLKTEMSKTRQRKDRRSIQSLPILHK